MTWPANDSPFWVLARVIVRAAVVFGCLAWVYDGLDKRDITTMVTFILTDAGLSTMGASGKRKK